LVFIYFKSRAIPFISIFYDRFEQRKKNHCPGSRFGIESVVDWPLRVDQLPFDKVFNIPRLKLEPAL